MNFITWAFVLLFLPIFACRLLLGRRKTERPLFALVVLASTIFVMWHVPIYLLIMLISIGVDYLAALFIDRAPDGLPRRLWLLFSIAVNLALLIYFKYANFALDSAEVMLAWIGCPTALPTLQLVLPMGISFYTFCSMSYTIDVYRRRIQPVRRFRDFYYFVTFFPHLVAGPIIRAEQFFYQMPRRRRLHLRVFNHAVYLIVRGLFLKMACADNIAPVVNAHWNHGYAPGAPSSELLLLAVMFAVQIFCDFEGYSSIARGVAYLLGYRFPINFNSPYIAASFRNFWERWHITLSQWLRDYLYVPLGGNRVSKSRLYANLLLVMVLGGLWHGAAMTFVAWGALHGLGLVVERLLGFHRLPPDAKPSPLRFLWYLIVQFTVLLTWVFFRSGSLEGALTFIRGMLAFRFALPPAPLLIGALFILPVLLMHLHQFLVERRILPPLGRLGKAALTGVMLYLTLMIYGASSDFIYFQF